MDALITEVVGDVALVLAVSALFGYLARRCGQPPVIGQILAGLLFGPTLLGRLPGHLTSRLFPSAALGYVNVLAQVAVVIFMFGVGYEIIWPKRGRRAAATPLLVAACALLLPMGLGAGAVEAFQQAFTAVGQRGIDESFVLFVAVAVSITALPVLAAIVRDRGLAGTLAGTMATSAAGLMDVAAWLVLVLALAGAGRGSGRPFAETLGLLLAFVAAMVFVVRPVLRWWSGRRAAVLADGLPAALVLALGSAWVTTWLGVHPMFGGFLAGLVMPRIDGVPDAGILRRTEDMGNLLLPLFFVVTGLSVDVGALNGNARVVLAVVCLVAVAGKLGAGYGASRIGGLGQRDAATVAILLNTRGLTELIALNAGLRAGVIGDRLFSVLVIMAVITTVMTDPLLRLFKARPPQPSPVAEGADASIS